MGNRKKRKREMYRMRHQQSERIGHWDNRDIVRYHYAPRVMSPTRYSNNVTPVNNGMVRPPTIGARRVRQTPTYESHIFTRHEWRETLPHQPAPSHHTETRSVHSQAQSQQQSQAQSQQQA